MVICIIISFSTVQRALWSSMRNSRVGYGVALPVKGCPTCKTLQLVSLLLRGSSVQLSSGREFRSPVLSLMQALPASHVSNENPEWGAFVGAARVSHRGVELFAVLGEDERSGWRRLMVRVWRSSVGFLGFCASFWRSGMFGAGSAADSPRRFLSHATPLSYTCIHTTGATLATGKTGPWIYPRCLRCFCMDFLRIRCKDYMASHEAR